MPFRILVADDHILDPRDSISELPALLEKAGFEVLPTASAEAVYDLAWEWRPDLIVLDIRFDGQPIDGVDICRALHDAESHTPVILITAVLNETEDVLRGFEAGASDYVRRPCDNREVLARVQANLPPAVVEIDDRLRIDYGGRRLWVLRAGEWQLEHLQPLQFELLQALAMNAGLIVPSTTLKDRVWGKDVSDGVLAVYIRHLRQAVEPDPDAPTYIETVRGLGYRFNGRPARPRKPGSRRR